MTTLLQAIVFGIMLGAIADFIYDIETAQPIPTYPDLQPINRRLVYMTLRQL